MSRLQNKSTSFRKYFFINTILKTADYLSVLNQTEEHLQPEINSLSPVTFPVSTAIYEYLLNQLTAN